MACSDPAVSRDRDVPDGIHDDRKGDMHLFQAVMDCHRRLIAAAEALRDQLGGTEPTPALVRLRFEMAIAVRENLIATQQLWSRIEQGISDIGTLVPGYDRLKAAESELHVRYAHHIATWPVAAIHADFRRFAVTKRRFLDDLCQHARLLEADFLRPACRLVEANARRGAGQA